MADAAKAFLTSLPPTLREKAAFPFDSPERENWHYVPKTRKGVPLKELDEAQKKAAMALLTSGLSEKGRLKADAIMALESVLAAMENNPRLRDPGLYCFTVFGEPGDAKGWGWRVEGHHLSVNLTIAGGSFAATPSFFGASPAELREGPKKGSRALAEEEDLARALAVTLAEAGKPVVFSPKPPGEILTAADRQAKQLEAVGPAAADLTPAQKDALMKLVGVYANRYRKEVAEATLAKIRSAGIDAIHFGWAGGLKPGEAYYYRIQGPTFLIEAANTQNQANHLHTVWRDFNGDFGRDFLGEHYRGHER